MAEAIEMIHVQDAPMLPFEIRVQKLHDNEVALEVWQESMMGWPARRAEPVRVARLKGAALHSAWDALMLVLHRAGVKASNLSAAHRDRAVRVPEDVGLRVALLTATIAPLRKQTRVETIAGAIGRMSYEEVCYWYAHVRAEHGRRALRALRLLLSADH